MLRFDSDYMEGCHPQILEALGRINYEKNTGYGDDVYSKSAAKKIKKACGCPSAEVYFISGGTLCNLVVISALIPTYAGVIAADTAHISTHEAGAIELTGHKVIYSGTDKLKASDVERVINTWENDGNKYHMVMPGMVYISQPTELGSLYSKAELEALYGVCRKYKVPLYVDGARLLYALGAPANDVDLKTLASLCDVFYIGGTKAGALLGEALVVKDPSMLPRFFTIMKQHGAVMAKGWVASLAFDVLFTDDMYLKVGAHTVNLAMKIKEGFASKGYELYMDSPTNQQFFRLTDEVYNELSQKVSFSFWEKTEKDHTVGRFVTSWATREEDVEELLEMI